MLRMRPARIALLLAFGGASGCSESHPSALHEGTVSPLTLALTTTESADGIATCIVRSFGPREGSPGAFFIQAAIDQRILSLHLRGDRTRELDEAVVRCRRAPSEAQQLGGERVGR